MTQPTPPRFDSRLFAVRAAILLNLLIAASYIALWMVSVRQKIYRGSDFTAFYTGWSIVRGGQAAQLYDQSVQTAYQRVVLGGGQFQDGFLPYLNPPYATLPFVPLAALSLETAFILWTIGQFALLVWLLHRLFQLSASWARTDRRLLASIIIAFPALFLTLILGTFSLLMLVCFVELYLALRGQRSGRAALWLVLATIKFQVIGLPVLMLLVGRRWRVLGYAGLLFSALVLLSGFVFGWEIWPQYLRFLGTTSSYFGVFGIKPQLMYTFRGLLATLLGNERGPLINSVSALAFAAVALVVAWLWRRGVRSDRPDFDLRFGLTLLLGLFFSPHLYPHDAMMLVAPGFLLALFLQRTNQPTHNFTLFAVTGSWAFLVTDVFGSLGDLHLPIMLILILIGWISLALWHYSQPAPLSIPMTHET